MTGRVKAGVLLAAGALGAGGAIAVGSVPDGGGTYHACYTSAVGGGTIPASGANIRLIDPSAGQSCDPASNEHAFTFDAQGPQGVPGVPGAQGPAGAPGTLETPAPDTTAGQVTLSGGRRTARANLAISGTTTFPFLTVGYDVTGPGSRLSGYGTARVPPPLVIVTRREDGLSAKLLQACAAGEHFQKLVLQVFKGGTTTPYETFTLTDAIITSVQFSSHGADVPEEAEHFAAQKVTVQFAAGASNALPAFRFSSTAKTKLKFPR
jgi:hypothetical protein